MVEKKKTRLQQEAALSRVGDVPWGRRYCIPDPMARLTDEVIIGNVPRGSHVLDLGCGDGRLLARLRDEHECTVQGVEVDHEEIALAIRRGVPVVQEDLDHGLSGIPDGTFDVAVLSQTLQQVRLPKQVLNEMLRVARRALVVVPNFGHWRVRMQVLNGRAPVTSSLPYDWYNTPNINFLSMLDFEEMARASNLKVLRRLPIMAHGAVERAWWPNLRAISALYVLERMEDR